MPRMKEVRRCLFFGHVLSFQAAEVKLWHVLEARAWQAMALICIDWGLNVHLLGLVRHDLSDLSNSSRVVTTVIAPLEIFRWIDRLWMKQQFYHQLSDNCTLQWSVSASLDFHLFPNPKEDEMKCVTQLRLHCPRFVLKLNGSKSGLMFGAAVLKRKQPGWFCQ